MNQHLVNDRLQTAAQGVPPRHSPFLTIGRLKLNPPAVQAALAGYSDLAMRLIARRCGAPYAISEGLLDAAVVAGGSHHRLTTLSDEDHPVAGQLLGSEPSLMAAAARQLANSGYDVIDINFGCPVRKVLGKARGGYLLGEPARALEIVARVRDALPEAVPLTLKMRRGLDDSPASTDCFFRILDGAFSLGVAAVIVHGRTVRQLYAGQADWDFLARVKAHLGPSRTLLGSGDVGSAGQAVRLLRETGLDGVSFARGSIGNPWIFFAFAAAWAGRPAPVPPTLPEQADIITEHYCLAAELYGPLRAERTLRKFVRGYAALHPYPARVSAALLSARTEEQRTSVLRDWYREFDPACPPTLSPAEPTLAFDRLTCQDTP